MSESVANSPNLPISIEFHHLLTHKFSQEELRGLFVDLGINYDAFSGEGTLNKSRELIIHMSKVKRLPDLLAVVKIHRPLVIWPDITQADIAVLRQPNQNRPWQLPRRTENFVNRIEEIIDLMRHLQPGQVVTLCGPGGIGKTALATEVVYQLDRQQELIRRFPDGVIYHDFYSQPEVALALEQIALTYGEEPRPSPQLAARRVLASRRMLLMLDGGEAADDLRQVLTILGQQCSTLLTSRKHSDAPNDYADIAPLPLTEAIALLQKWGGERAKDRKAVSKMCKLVGGLPLAVRLMGKYLQECGEYATDYLTWLENQPLEALNLGERQERSVPLLLERSVNQLSEVAKQALSVVGMLALAPFSWETIAAALALEGGPTRRYLGELINYGLLQREEEEYQVTHALIHTFSRNRLPIASEQGEQLGKYFSQVAQYEGGRGIEGYTVLDRIRIHIMATIGNLATQQQWQTGLDLTWAMNHYLTMQGYWTERQQILQFGVQAAQSLNRRQDEGSLLGDLGNTYRDFGQVEEAINYYEQALDICREIGDRQGEGDRLGNLGAAYSALGRVEEAISYYEQGLDIAREIGYQQGEGNHLGNLGLAYSDLGRAEEAISYHEQALVIAHEIGYQQGVGNHLGNLGNAYSDLGRVEEAVGYYEQALAIAREIGDRLGEGNRLGNLGNIYRDLGRAEESIGYYEQGLDIAREIGHRQGEGVHLGNLGNAYSALGRVEEAIGCYKQSLVIAREIGYRLGEGNHLGNLGTAYSSLGRTEEAISYYEQALVIAREIGHRLGEGVQLANLGDAYNSLGRVEEAVKVWQESLAILEEIKSPNTEIVKQWLDEAQVD